MAGRNQALSRWEMRILEELRGGGLQEKSIARRACLDKQIAADLITGLMFKGHVERSMRRRMLFFSREYFMITAEGLAALESTRNDLDRIIEIIKARGQAMADEILAGLPPLAAVAIKATYRATKFILR